MEAGVVDERFAVPSPTEFCVSPRALWSHLRGRPVDSVLSRLGADKILIFLDFRANSVGSRIQFLGDWQAAGGWGRLVVLIHTRIIPQ